MQRIWKKTSVSTCLMSITLSLIAFSNCSMATGDSPHYIRIKTSPKDIVYVEFKGKEMRLATAAEGLAQAEPIKAAIQGSRSKAQPIQFPEVLLPVPPKQAASPKAHKPTSKPKTQAYAMFGLYSRQGKLAYVMTHLFHRGKDAKNATWEYQQNFGTPPSRLVKKANTVAMADIDKLTVDITAKPGSNQRMGIAVQVVSGKGRSKAILSDVKKNKKPVQVSVTVLDAAGSEVMSKKGTLADFAFG